MSDGFALDPQLARESVFVADRALCRVLLMDDARFPWLVLVPRRAGLVELCDLNRIERTQLWSELERAGEALRAAMPFTKLNVGALGNVVRQLHVHVIGRHEGDAAWPGPVWGHGPRQPCDESARATRVRAIAARLGSG
ncbi:MAG: HIT family protein [Xanthomonadaceae bacterium]|nr:HIT family protein [Xanthomonadaceae bacterium]MDE1959782.1 HIT family protein [Xanthomonadaceae bacterium]